MTHEMKLQPKYFDFVRNGSKRIELRLFDDKRKAILLGETIKFLKEPGKTENLEVTVTGLLRYSKFEDLIKDFDISVLADSSITKEDLLNDLEKFYSKKDQENFGVLGIRFKLHNFH